MNKAAGGAHAPPAALCFYMLGNVNASVYVGMYRKRLQAQASSPNKQFY
jgi:hypothetical protein